MVDAGRILIMPKGIWSNLVSYEMLDVVTQDNIAYLARQSSVGVSPKNDSSYTYWQPFGTSVTPDGETIIMNSAGNITANIDNKSLIYDDINMYVKVAIDGSTIKYDNSDGYLYVDASNFNINDLNNISITSPANGQVLVYDSTTQKWKNGQGSVSPIDNLTSNSTTQPLSANQGRVLNNQKLEKEIISDAWNASTTYEVGQYCIYNNSLWKCLIQHSGQTPTEGTYWTKVSVANEITSVNNSLVANSNHFYFDYKDGKYGFNTNSNRGADTFFPFKNIDLSNSKIVNVFYYSKWYVSVDISVSKGDYLVLTAIHADNSLTNPGIVSITNADKTEKYIPFTVNGLQASELSGFTCNSNKTINISHSNGIADGNGYMFYVVIKL